MKPVTLGIRRPLLPLVVVELEDEITRYIRDLAEDAARHHAAVAHHEAHRIKIPPISREARSLRSREGWVKRRRRNDAHG